MPLRNARRFERCRGAYQRSLAIVAALAAPTRQMKVDDPTAEVGEVMAVLAAVNVVEGLEGLGQRRLVDRAVGKGRAARSPWPT